MKFNFLKLTGLVLIFAVLLNACEKDDDDIISTYAEKEQNGTFATATELDRTNTFDAKIDPAQDQDYYVIDATTDVEITIDGDENLELYLYTFNEAYTSLYNGDTGARGASLTHVASANGFNGKLYIMVESAYPGDTGSYTIRLK